MQGTAEAATGQTVAVPPAYGVEDMTFELEEEKIPVYRPPKEDDNDGDAAAPGTSIGTTPLQYTGLHKCGGVIFDKCMLH